MQDLSSLLPWVGAVAGLGAAGFGAVAAARTIPAVLRSGTGFAPSDPDHTTGRARRRAAVRSTSIVGVAGDALRHDDGSYTAAWRCTLSPTMLAPDHVLDSRVDALARLLALDKPAGTIIQIRYSTNPDPGLAISRHHRTRSEALDVHAPSRLLHDLGLASYSDMATACAYRHSQLTIWIRVPSPHARDVARNGTEAVARQVVAAISRHGLRGIGSAWSSAREEMSGSALTRRMLSDEIESVSRAERTFRLVSDSGLGNFNRLGAAELWRAVYLGHNLSARSEPALPSDTLGAALDDYLCAESIASGSDYVLHGQIPAAMVSLFTPPHPEADPAALRALVAHPGLTFRHTVATEYVTLPRDASKRRLDRRIAALHRSSNLLSGKRRYTPEAQRALAELTAVRQELVTTGEALVRARTWAVVYAPAVRSAEDLTAATTELDERVEAIVSSFRRIGGADAAREEPAALSILYPSTLPGELSLAKSGREIEEVTTSVAALAPLETEWQGSPTPHTIVATRSGRLVGIDLFDIQLTGPPVALCLGQMGSGKSALMARIANDVLATSAHATVKAVDFGESLRPLAEVTGGRILRFSEDDYRPINSWDYAGIESGEPPDQAQMTLVTDELAKLARVPADDPVAEAILATVVRQVYENEVPYNIGNSERHEPTLSHALSVLEVYPWASGQISDRAATLALQLGVYRDHPWLDRPTDPSFRTESPFDLFELDSLDAFPKDIREALAYRVAARITRAIGARRPDGTRAPLLAIFDEMWKVRDRYPAVLDALRKGARQGRKEMAVLMLATHAYEDLDRLWDVVANAGVKFIGKQTGSIDALVRDGALAPAAVAAIRSLHMQPGVYAQYVASFGSGPDQIVVDLQVDLAPVELWTFTTHPLERNARERVARLLPRLSTAEVIAWLATEYPRGLIAAGLRAVDESRITAERGPQ